MTLSYAAFYFVPPAAPHAIDLDVTDVWNVSFVAGDLTNCSPEVNAIIFLGTIDSSI